jgi:hypothetical protein
VQLVGDTGPVLRWAHSPCVDVNKLGVTSGTSA